MRHRRSAPARRHRRYGGVATRTAGCGRTPVGAFEVAKASIAQLQEALASGRTNSRALVEAYLARVCAYDRAGPHLNAVITLNAAALAEADALDRERRLGGPRGPLHGIPVLVKDNIDTADMPTSGGTIALATYRPRVDAGLVARLRAAGATVP